MQLLWEIIMGHIDNKLTFDYHIFYICKKASKKMNVPARIVS